jgi:hypothetical protein
MSLHGPSRYTVPRTHLVVTLVASSAAYGYGLAGHIIGPIRGTCSSRWLQLPIQTRAYIGLAVAALAHDQA